MNPKHITIHCSATQPKNPFSVERLRWLHVEKKRWSDIGYHFYITQDGCVHKCRPLKRNGAHVLGHNKDNIGVCLEGGLSDTTGKPCCNYTLDQFDSLKELLIDLMSKYNIDKNHVKGHRDWFDDKNGDGIIDRRDWLKECPCMTVSVLLKKWRF